MKESIKERFKARIMEEFTVLDSDEQFDYLLSHYLTYLDKLQVALLRGELEKMQGHIKKIDKIEKLAAELGRN